MIRAKIAKRSAKLKSGFIFKFCNLYQKIKVGNFCSSSKGVSPVELQYCLSPDEVCKRYRDAITHYSKYLNATVLETEACFKAARVAMSQNKKLQASSFLQNVLLINLNLTEEHKIERFLAIANLYDSLQFHRKASFFKRLAGMRHVSAQNQNPDWSQCYQLLVQALPGIKLSLDPKEMITGNFH